MAKKNKKKVTKYSKLIHKISSDSCDIEIFKDTTLMENKTRNQSLNWVNDMLLLDEHMDKLSKKDRKEVLNEIDEKLKNSTQFEADETQYTSTTVERTVEDLLKLIPASVNENNTFNAFLLQVKYSMYRYLAYDCTMGNKLECNASSSIIDIPESDVAIYYGDLIFLSCCLIQPSVNLKRLVNDFLGIDENMNVVHKKAVDFPKRMAERAIECFDLSTDITFGLKLFTVLYNITNRSETNLPYLDMSMCEGGKISINPPNVQTNSITREIRTQNRLSKNNTKINLFESGNELSNNRYAYSILDQFVKSEAVDIDMIKLTALVTNFARDTAHIESMDTKEFLPDIKLSNTMLTRLNSLGESISDSVFSGADTDPISAIVQKPRMPKELTQSIARLPILENYVYGVLGDELRPIKKDSLCDRLASRVANTTYKLTGSSEDAYVDYFYTNSLTSLLLDKIRLTKLNRKFLIEKMSNIFADDNSISPQEFDSMKEEKEAIISEKQEVINKQEDTIFKLRTQLDSLSNHVNDEDSHSSVDNAQDESPVFIDKNVNNLDVCIVTDMKFTKNCDLLEPLFGSTTVIDIDDVKIHSFKSYDYVVVRYDRISHASMYKIKSENKRVIEVEKPDARNWLPTIMYRLN